MALETGRLKAHTGTMDEKHPKRPRDLSQWAKRMIDIARAKSRIASRRQRSRAKTQLLWNWDARETPC